MDKFVDIETPYSGPTEAQVKLNIRYARASMRDCLKKGEIPLASHLLFTQPGILDDNIPGERDLGISAGKVKAKHLKATTVVYTDLGISKGMQFGINLAKKEGRNIEYRSLGKSWEADFSKHENGHSHSGVW